jgi:hypothetical protein
VRNDSGECDGVELDCSGLDNAMSMTKEELSTVLLVYVLLAHAFPNLKPVTLATTATPALSTISAMKPDSALDGPCHTGYCDSDCTCKVELTSADSLILLESVELSFHECPALRHSVELSFQEYQAEWQYVKLSFLECPALW